MPLHPRLSRPVLFFALMASSVPISLAQSPAPPADRLKNAAELSALDSMALKPWHMKADLTLFDTDGKNPQAASVEVWWANGNMKEVESLGTKQVTNVNAAGKLYRVGSDDPVFIRIDGLLQQVIHPIPDEVIAPAIVSKQDRSNFGKVKLDCIVPQLAHPSSTLSINRPLSYCLDTTSDRLDITIEPGRVASVRRQIGTFQSKEIPVDLQLISGETLRDEVKVTELATYSAAESDFTPAADMQPFPGTVELKPTELLGQMLSNGPPIYPMIAKEQRIGGTVKFDAVIGPDGHIISLVAIGTPNPDLQQSATDAVRNWLYRPLSICGVPVSIKTEITVNFNIG